MTIGPGLYSRNKLFAFFKDPEIKRARARAAQLRGIVRQLGGAQGAPAIVELTRPREAGRAGVDADAPAVLSFTIPPIRLARRIELTDLEAACLVFVCARAGLPFLKPAPDDRAALDAALHRLSGGITLGGLSPAGHGAEVTPALPTPTPPTS